MLVHRSESKTSVAQLCILIEKTTDVHKEISQSSLQLIQSEFRTETQYPRPRASQSPPRLHSMLPAAIYSMSYGLQSYNVEAVASMHINI